MLNFYKTILILHKSDLDVRFFWTTKTLVSVHLFFEQAQIGLAMNLKCM